MTNKIKLPCGLNKDGKLIYIEEAIKKQEYFCPGCKQKLIAKKGTERAHHFAHLNIVECEHGYQSALHYMAKDLFLEMKHLTFIKNGKIVQYKIDSVELETRISAIIPDILVTCDGKHFFVEIFVTHAVDDEKKAKIKEMQISAIEINLSRFKNDLINRETLKTELCRTENFSWLYDADVDLLEQKRNITQQFGLKLPIQIGNAIGCPILATQQNQFARFVTLDFCLHCPNCVYQNGQNFVCCGRVLPTPLSPEIRQKLYANVFVNEAKVLFASEFKKYYESFAKNLEIAMQTQYRVFLNIGRGLYAPSIFSSPTIQLKNSRPRQNHSYHKGRW